MARGLSNQRGVERNGVKQLCCEARERRLWGLDFEDAIEDDKEATFGRLSGLAQLAIGGSASIWNLKVKYCVGGHRRRGAHQLKRRS